MYRTPPPGLFDLLAERLSPLGFVAIERRWLHRKTWNTNRAVALTGLASSAEITAAALRLREEAKTPMKHSWWSQLGLQLVFSVPDRVPSHAELARLVDHTNHQGVLVQSVFVVNEATGEVAEARTWGQFVTGKFQDAIQNALAAHGAHGLRR